ncbi:hypothetical protein [Halomonas urumqiensis]|uniref:hypothetical protein n=1 Tax=Halomonas urumqiensis TaxID=1684789 RepID=UPI0015E0A5C8|nr:hypothetical protein [Halomonas urumqiensis]GHE20298.1 hypothetical protein GCM10017767_08190 [Halomonas urumqiensis]
MNQILSLMHNDTFMEFARLGILYAHLLACCIAIAMILKSDVKLVRSLFSQQARDSLSPQHLESLQRGVSRTLTVLWISGAAIIGLDVFVQGAEYLANPKLQAKIVVVSVLTLNGMVLHHAVLPRLARVGSLMDLAGPARLLAVGTGALSGVSWAFAALLGIGRPLSWKYSLSEILAAYPVAVVGGTVVMMVLIHIAQRRRDEDRVTHQATRQEWRMTAIAS